MEDSSQQTHEWAETVAAGEAGRRLDQWLAGRLAELSRMRVKGLIEAGKVLVDQRVVKAGYRVRVGERVVVTIPPTPSEGLAAEAIALSVVFEDAHLLVVDKPAGMVTHPGPGQRGGTLAAAALAHAPLMASVGSPKRPGIVHRLDKGTSGLIVLAKTQQAYDGLTAQLARRTVSRRYLCLAQGSVQRAEGKIDATIGRDPRSRVRMAVVKEGRGKRAVTYFRVLERFGSGASAVSFLECRLETGRTHQIRVHLASLGHPLLGDDAYRGRRGGPARDPVLVELVEGLGGVALHAASLAFAHPVTGEPMSFSCPPPDRIGRLLSHLRNRLR
ncbi:MAG TPA: RluA family pseudouridine synthase [Methylomirabilota bacterium]|nr:RluA family pseudouridine synthase [Methylomirabilota bacterium]